MKPFVIALGTILIICAVGRAEDKVIVHEWGTFTCLQDEHGHAIGGINVDDEPVPSFVIQAQGGQEVAAQYSHDLGNFGLPPYLAGKGWASGDPNVTMRLETPVIYIYPPKGQTPESVAPLDVHVDFHGGILTQYYPYAEALPFNGLAQVATTTNSSLSWKGVRLGSTGKPVETDDKVWITPREVSAPLLKVMMPWRGGDGQPDPVVVPQTEHFLFYRGVGHLDSPLLLNQTSLDAGKRGDILPWCHKILAASPSFKAPVQGTVDAEAWLADIHADGSCHWEYLPISFDPGGSGVAGKFIDFKDANFTKLKASMHDALVKEGLYDDEATAMLKTWELSYFKSPGLRFFYIVPRAWVDEVLPLTITGAPMDVKRVMVGRIELITHEQRQELARLRAGPCPDLASFKQAAEDKLAKGNLPPEEVKAYYRGEKPLSDLGMPIPPLVQDYLNLGRFRDALIMLEQQEHPSHALAMFIHNNRLDSGNFDTYWKPIQPGP